jgi:hypothetical protein
VIAEFRHLRNFDALDDAFPDGDLGVLEALAKRKAQGAKVDVDVVLGPNLKVARQRPVACYHQKRSVQGDQQRGANDGLGPEVQSQKSEAVALKSKHHENISINISKEYRLVFNNPLSRQPAATCRVSLVSCNTKTPSQFA